MASRAAQNRPGRSMSRTLLWVSTQAKHKLPRSPPDVWNFDAEVLPLSSLSDSDSVNNEYRLEKDGLNERKACVFLPPPRLSPRERREGLRRILKIKGQSGLLRPHVGLRGGAGAETPSPQKPPQKQQGGEPPQEQQDGKPPQQRQEEPADDCKELSVPEKKMPPKKQPWKMPPGGGRPKDPVDEDPNEGTALPCYQATYPIVHHHSRLDPEGLYRIHGPSRASQKKPVRPETVTPKAPIKESPGLPKPDPEGATSSQTPPIPSNTVTPPRTPVIESSGLSLGEPEGAHLVSQGAPPLQKPQTTPRTTTPPKTPVAESSGPPKIDPEAMPETPIMESPGPPPKAPRPRFATPDLSNRGQLPALPPVRPTRPTGRGSIHFKGHPFRGDHGGGGPSRPPKVSIGHAATQTNLTMASKEGWKHKAIGTALDSDSKMFWDYRRGSTASSYGGETTHRNSPRRLQKNQPPQADFSGLPTSESGGGEQNDKNANDGKDAKKGGFASKIRHGLSLRGKKKAGDATKAKSDGQDQTSTKSVTDEASTGKGKSVTKGKSPATAETN
ncbi:hypothetical protein B0T16DRAFT_387125 [Cercophora newfieldiana]|uniref:Uncharacterized protein n=1 Tax=Cercophora newfieldiana TaxID=92897 RepID=A0AA39YFL5_9PEZI|nr:hypothetical protein B0T16DRAFT_387125 [Cercophora newfieldiana]